MLNSVPALLMPYPKMSRLVVIRKCYARMSDPASGDKLSLEVIVSDGGLKILSIILIKEWDSLSWYKR